MGVSAISQAVVKKSRVCSGRGGSFIYDPAVERVGVLIKGLDDQCVAVPVGANDIYQGTDRAASVGLGPYDPSARARSTGRDIL